MTNYERLVVALTCRTTFEVRQVYRAAQEFWAHDLNGLQPPDQAFYSEESIRAFNDEGKRPRRFLGFIKRAPMIQSHRMAIGYLLLTLAVKNVLFVWLGIPAALVLYAYGLYGLFT